MNLSAIKLSACTLSCFVATATTAFSLRAIQARTVFDRWDRNGDGKLTRAGITGKYEGRILNAPTATRNGFISRQEDSLFRKKSGQSAGKRGNRPEPANASLKIESDIAYAGTDNPRQTLNLILPVKRGKKLTSGRGLHSWRRLAKR